ncbi:hypothetical protein [Bartonella sp. DGB1]|uniref:hypothetical protein n=1 Tax=Bartonella sp. DGB1 TaxID=3239807 RepID=UPI0035233832
MTVIIFCHGFAYNKNYWSNLTPSFTDSEIILLDLGYFNNEVNYPNLPKQANIIGIGHSLGLLKLLSLPIKFNKLIALNGFINFLGYSSTLRQRRTREINLLKNAFIRNPQKQLRHFYDNCGTNDLKINERLNLEKLLNDLNFLATNIIIPQTPILMLNSDDDIIVPTELLKDNLIYFKPTKQIITEGGKHALGWLKSDLITQEIKSFIYD